MSVHLVKGVDPILRDEALSALVSELLGDDDRSFALEEFSVPAESRGDSDDENEEEESWGTPFGSALNAASTAPMMTSKRVVVVRDVGNLSGAEVKQLEAYLDAEVETTELVLVVGGTARKAAATTTAIEKLVQSTGTISGPSSEKPADVLERATRDAGLTLSPDAVKLVLSRAGGDAGMLPSVVETLASALGVGADLDAADVDPYLTDTGAIPMWDLTNAIERGDIPEALSVLQRLLTVTSPSQPKALDPLQVMGYLHGHYRRLLRLDDPHIRNNDEAAAALGGRGSAKSAGFRLRQSRALGTDGLRQAFDHLASADLDLKGERAIPPDTVMAVLVARLAALTSRSTRGGSRRR
jgi:DNA polymerase III delta subunit